MESDAFDVKLTQEDLAQSLQARGDLLVVDAEEGISNGALLSPAKNDAIELSLPQRGFYPLQV